jgi:hypothetical protein
VRAGLPGGELLASLCWNVTDWNVQVHPNPILRAVVPALPAGAPLLDTTLLLPQALLAAHAPDITCLVGCSAQVLFPVTLQPQPGTIQLLQLDRVMPGAPGAAPVSALLYLC